MDNFYDNKYFDLLLTDYRRSFKAVNAVDVLNRGLYDYSTPYFLGADLILLVPALSAIVLTLIFLVIVKINCVIESYLVMKTFYLFLK